MIVFNTFHNYNLQEFHTNYHKLSAQFLKIHNHTVYCSTRKIRITESKIRFILQQNMSFKNQWVRDSFIWVRKLPKPDIKEKLQFSLQFIPEL